MAQTILEAQRASHTLSGAHGSHLTGLPYLQEGVTRTSFLSVLQLAEQVSFLLAIPLLHVPPIESNVHCICMSPPSLPLPNASTKSNWNCSTLPYWTCRQKAARINDAPKFRLTNCPVELLEPTATTIDFRQSFLGVDPRHLLCTWAASHAACLKFGGVLHNLLYRS